MMHFAKSRQSVLPLQKEQMCFLDGFLDDFACAVMLFGPKSSGETPRLTTSTCMRLKDLGRERDEKHTSIAGVLGRKPLVCDAEISLRCDADAFPRM